jgi:hypothetical protein
MEVAMKKTMVESLSPDFQIPDHVSPAEARPRRWRWVAAVLVALLVLVWLAPILVAHSPARNWILAWVASAMELRGKATAGSASLGWFSSVSMSAIEIHDPKDQPVLEVTQVTADRSLLGLLWDFRRLGHVRLEKPKLSLVLRDDGSNLEDLLAAYLQPKSESSGSVDIQVEIVDAQVAVTHPRTQQAWLIDQAQLTLAMPAESGQPWQMQTSGVLADPRHPGRFEAGLKMAQSGGKPDEFRVRAERLPLAMAAPIFSRFSPGTRTEGWFSGLIECQSASLAKLEQVSIQGQVAAEDFGLSSPSLGTDQVALNRLQAACQLAWQGQRFQVNRLTVDSDLGNISAAGLVDLTSTTSTTSANATGKGATGNLGWLQQTYDIQGNVDLARLAAMLPATLRIRKETRITSGQLQVSLASQPKPEGMTWLGRIDTRHLTALRQGRQLAWEQPVLISLAAHQAPQGIVVDNLRCDSDFLKVEASGTSEEFNATANLDLNRLVGQLSGLVDLGSLRLAGDGWARLHWRQPPGQDFQADGQLQVQKFHLSTEGRPPWTEEKLWANLAASGRFNSSADTRLETATLELKAGDDRFDAQLLQPAPDVRSGAWAVAVRSGGELARLLPRLSPWVTIPDGRLAGSYTLEGQLIRAANSLAIRDAKLTLDQLQVQTAGWNVQETHAELVASGGWDSLQRRFDLQSATLASSGLSGSTAGLVVALPTSGPAELAGTVTCQTNLERLQQWMTSTAQPSTWRMGGQLTGKIEMRPSPAGAAIQVDASVANLLVANQSGQQFQEPQVRLVGRAAYQSQSGALVVEQAELTSGTVGVSGTGQYASKENKDQLQVEGKVQYDLEKLSALARSYLGDGIYARGRGASPVAYRGPLAIRGGQGSASLAWQAANVYGFEVSPGEIQVMLSGDLLLVKPLDLAVSEGRVRMAPQVQWTEGATTFSMASGRVADQIRINPVMCAHALQYIAPVMAGVATAEGRFSIEMEGCKIPLSEPTKGELAGRMIIHSVQVGPGPLIQELALVLGYASPAQLSRESVIPFRMADGRVYHQNLELVFPDVTIRTQGSVGLDQTLAITAEMPVPKKWIGNNPLGAALKDQTIRVPIGGTLTKPAIDRSTLDRLSQQFLRNAAQNVLLDQVNRNQGKIQQGLEKFNQRLDRLFAPPQPVK